MRGPFIKYLFNGKEQSINQWAKELGLNAMTLRRRMRSGLTFEESIVADCRSTHWQGTKYFFGGKSQTINKWAKELYIAPSTIHRRLNLGMTFEEAITTPVKSRSYVFKSLPTRRAWKTWKDIHARCSNPKHPFYERYGAKHITVCKAWKKFPHFLKDMGPCPTSCHLHRRNRRRGFSKDNCYWKFILRGVEINGETRTLAAWAKLYDIQAGTIRKRVADGMSYEEAMLQPVRPTARKTDKFLFFLRRFSDDELREELLRREDVRVEGLCPHCLRKEYLCEARRCKPLVDMEAAERRKAGPEYWQSQRRD